MSAPLRCGLVGVGMIGREHARILASLPETELVATCDIDPDAVHGVPPGVAFTTDFDELLSTPGLESVHVCVPQHLHAAIVLPALERGLDVFCEKPMAYALDDADRMIRAAEAAATTLVIGHSTRFDANYATAAEAVHKGAVGEIVSMSARWAAPNFEGRIISGRATVPQEMMIHDIDVMQWVAGPVARVYAEASPREVVGPGPDSAVAALRFAGGAIGTLDHNWIAPAEAGMKSDHQLVIYGTEGALFIDSQDTPLTIFDREGFHRPDVSYYSHPHGIPTGSVPNEDRHYVRHVREGSPWPVALEEARAALACAVAIEQSIAAASPVTLDGIG